MLLRANPSYEDAEVSDREINSIKMWRRSQALANFFWTRFTKEYLPNLTERKKWKEKRQNLKEGDVVLVAKPNQPRGVWPLGRIVSTHPERNGLVRAVTVRTQDGEYERRLLNFVYQRKRKCRTVDERCVSTGGGDVPPASSTFITSRVTNDRPARC